MVSNGRVGFNPSVRPIAFFLQPALEDRLRSRVDDMAIDKRKALQPVLDSIEQGWQITKPDQ
jgi:hypothetical protein